MNELYQIRLDIHLNTKLSINSRFFIDRSMKQLNKGRESIRDNALKNGMEYARRSEDNFRDRSIRNLLLSSNVYTLPRRNYSTVMMVGLHGTKIAVGSRWRSHI